MQYISQHKEEEPIKAKELSIIIPVHDEKASITTVLSKIQEMIPSLPCTVEVIVVDDGSTDGTFEVLSESKMEGLKIIRHPYRMGNGAAVKTGLRNANMPLVAVMDGDGQHDPLYFKDLLPLTEDFAMVVGSRPSKDHANFPRRFVNIIYNRLASFVTGHAILDLTSGFRIISTSLARKFLFLLPNGFSSPTTLTMAFLRSGYPVTFHPIRVSKRKGKSKIRPLRDGFEFLQIILKIALFYSPFRLFFPMSVIMIGSGGGYYLYRLITTHRFTNMSLLLILSGIFVFVAGLISEQLTALLYGLCETQKREQGKSKRY